MIDLNKFLPRGTGWQLTDAYSVNDSGWIVGNGSIHGSTYAYLLKPR